MGLFQNFILEDFVIDDTQTVYIIYLMNNNVSDGYDVFRKITGRNLPTIDNIVGFTISVEFAYSETEYELISCTISPTVHNKDVDELFDTDHTDISDTYINQLIEYINTQTANLQQPN